MVEPPRTRIEMNPMKKGLRLAGETPVGPAVSTEGAHYALTYVRALRAGRGTKVLVHGATGAIGSARVNGFFIAFCRHFAMVASRQNYLVTVVT